MNTKCKKLGFLLVMILMGITLNVSIPTEAASTSDNTFETANSINIGTTINGSITEEDDLDYYKFTLSSAGSVTLNMTSYMKNYCIRVYDSAAEEIWNTDYNEWTESVGYRQDTYDLYLERGTYYMQINGYLYGTAWKSTGRYECSSSFVSSGVTNMESDNSFSEANQIVAGDMIVGQISENDDFDTYKFSLSSAGSVTLNMTAYMKNYCIRVYDSAAEEIWYTDYNEWTESVGYRRDTYNLYLEKGTYYMQINGYQSGTWGKTVGKYQCSTSFISTVTSFDGDDNSFGAAKAISYGTTYKGQISINDDYDNYKFAVSKSGYVVVSITSYMDNYCITIYDKAGKEIWYTDGNGKKENTTYRKDTHDVKLNAGTYYMQINGYQSGTWGKTMGKYTFSVAKLTQSNCTHEYKEKTVDSTYLSRGYTLHKCEKCGKSYKDNYQKKLALGQGYIWSYGMKAGKKKITVSFQSIYNVSGYQIRYSTDKKFKQKVKILKIGRTKTSKTIKKLKKHKKYYVQIRGYKKVKGKIVYGKWSKKRSAKTR